MRFPKSAPNKPRKRRPRCARQATMRARAGTDVRPAGSHQHAAIYQRARDVERPAESAWARCKAKTHFPIVLDLVEDRVRTRTISIATVTAVFTVVFSVIFPAVLRDPLPLLDEPNIASLKLYVPPYSTIAFGDPIASAALPIKLRIVNVKGIGLPGKAVNFSIVSGVQTCTVNVPGTLDALLADALCNPSLRIVGTPTNTSDVDGVVTLTDLALLSGYPGQYQLFFTHTEPTAGQTFSTSFFVQMVPKVGAMTVAQSTPLPGTAQSFTPFSTQPSVTVVDAIGNPVPGKMVIASVPVDNAINSVAILANNVAYSDTNGVATFSGLQVTEYSGPSQTIQFFSDGASAAWVQGTTSVTSVAPAVGSITVPTAPLSVMEGAPLAPLTVILKDASGNPVANALAFASISPFSAAFGKQAVGVVSAPSDSTGAAVFQNISFTVKGSIGDYQLQFSARGYTSPTTILVTVTTSVVFVVRELNDAGDPSPLCTDLSGNNGDNCLVCNYLSLLSQQLQFPDAGLFVSSEDLWPINVCGLSADNPASFSDIMGLWVSVLDDNYAPIADKPIAIRTNTTEVIASVPGSGVATDETGLIQLPLNFFNFVPNSTALGVYAEVIVSVDGVDMEPIPVVFCNPYLANSSFIGAGSPSDKFCWFGPPQPPTDNKAADYANCLTYCNNTVMQNPGANYTQCVIDQCHRNTTVWGAFLFHGTSTARLVQAPPATAVAGTPWPPTSAHAVVHVTNNLGWAQAGVTVCPVVLWAEQPQNDIFAPLRINPYVTYLGPYGPKGYGNDLYLGNASCGVSDANGDAIVAATGEYPSSFSSTSPSVTVNVAFVALPEDSYKLFIFYFAQYPLFTGQADTMSVKITAAVGSATLSASNPSTSLADVNVVFRATVLDTTGAVAANVPGVVSIVAPNNFAGCTALEYFLNVTTPANEKVALTVPCASDTTLPVYTLPTMSDANGVVSWAGIFAPGAIGSYSWSISIGGVSTPYQALTILPPSGVTLTIATMPSFPVNYTLGLPFGTPGFTPPLVVLSPYLGLVQIGCRVTTGNAILQNAVTVAGPGGALFSKLAIIATTSAGNVGLQFYYGDPGTPSTLVTTTTIYVYVDDWLELNIGLDSAPSRPSFYVNSNRPFEKPIKVGITTHVVSQAVAAGARNLFDATDTGLQTANVPSLDDIDSLVVPINALVGINYLGSSSPDVAIIEAVTSQAQLVHSVMRLSDWRGYVPPGDPVEAVILPSSYTFTNLQFGVAQSGPYIIKFRMAGTNLYFTTSLGVVSSVLNVLPAQWPVVVSDEPTDIAISSPSTTEDSSISLNSPLPATVHVSSSTGAGVVGVSIIPVIMSAPDNTLAELSFSQTVSSADVIAPKAFSKLTQQPNQTRGDAIFNPGVAFRAGISGTYQVGFRADGKKVLSAQQITVQLTNPLTAVSVGSIATLDGGPVIVGVPNSMSPLTVTLTQPSSAAYRHYIVIRPYTVVDNSDSRKPPTESLDTAAILSYPNLLRDTNNVLSIPVSFQDGLNENYRLEVIVDGVIGARSDVFALSNPRRLSPARLSAFTNYVYLVAVASIPLFIGNSERLHPFYMVFSFVASASYLGAYIFYTVDTFGGDKTDGVAPNGFEVFLVTVAMVNLVLIFGEFLMLVGYLVTYKARSFYWSWRGARSVDLVDRLVTEEPPPEPDLPPRRFGLACCPRKKPYPNWEPIAPAEPARPESIKGYPSYAKPYVKHLLANRKWEAERDRRLGKNYHKPYESKTDFVYPQRLLFGVSLSVMFTIIAVLLTVVGLLWADYFLSQLAAVVENLSLTAQGFLRTPEFQAVLQLDLTAVQQDANLLAQVSQQYGPDVVQAAIQVKAAAGAKVTSTAEQYDSLINDQLGPFFGKMLGKFSAFTSIVMGGPSSLDATSLDSNSVAFIEQLNTLVQNLISDIRVALYVASIIAAIIAFGMVVLCVVAIMRAYRRDTMLVRRGKLPYDLKNFSIEDAPSYVGYQIAHAVVAFVIAYFVLTIVIFVLSWTVIRVFLWKRVRAILLASLSINLVFKAVYPILMRAFLIDAKNQTIRHRRYFSLFDNIYMFIGVLAGLAAAVGRIVASFTRLVVNFIRLDISSVPGREVWKDPGFASYVAMLLIDNAHSNPVAMVFAYTLIAGMMDRRRQATSGDAPMIELGNIEARLAKRERLRTRWWLLVTLSRNPSLVQTRGWIMREALAMKRKSMDKRASQFGEDKGAMVTTSTVYDGGAMTPKEDISKV